MTKEESDLIITEQNKSTEEILKAVAKVKSDYHELCKLKDKRIAELEKKISVLLSCKNCPENKGGLLCVKEYENKCLAQKIQYIKELQEENAELKADNDARKFAMAMSEKVEKQLREENAKLKEALEGYKKIAKWCDKCDKIAELKSDNTEWEKASDKWKSVYELTNSQLTKAKEIIKKFSEFVHNENEYDPEHPQEHTDLWNKLCEEAEQFLNCSEKPNN